MKGSVRIPNNVIALSLSGAELKTYAVISALCYANNGKYVKISQQSIAYHAGISISTVKRALRGLLYKKAVDICKTFANGQRHADRYRARYIDSKERYVVFNLNTVRDFCGEKLLTYAGLLTCINADGRCYISERRLAKKTGLSVPTVRKYTSELKKEGALEKYARYYKKSRPTKARRCFAYVLERLFDTSVLSLKKKNATVISKASNICKRIFAAVKKWIKSFTASSIKKADKPIPLFPSG